MSDQTFYSSPCSMADTDPAYHGFLTGEEVIDLLATLLHAERAGVRVCHLSRRDAPTERHRQLLRDIQRDEASSCRGLIGSLKNLGAEPDHTVGDFAEKCLAITDFDERLRFLNRGQGWVAKKIAEALPRVQQESVQRQLADMLDDHRRNIDTVNAFLKNGS
jgi:nitronate monooxygenase